MKKVKKIQYFENNDNGKDFIVGDIHGHFLLLMRQLLSLGFDKKKDRLFALGDLIDRGPESHRVLDYLDKPWFYSIKGNHEVMAHQYHYDGEWKKTYEKYGGKWFIDLPNNEKSKHVRRLDELPIAIQINSNAGVIGLVHAQCPYPDWVRFVNNIDALEDRALWGYDRYQLAQSGEHYYIENIDYVFNGHVNVQSPLKSANSYFIDTGKMSKKLTLVEIDDDKIKIHH